MGMKPFDPVLPGCRRRSVRDLPIEPEAPELIDEGLVPEWTEGMRTTERIAGQGLTGIDNDRGGHEAVGCSRRRVVSASMTSVLWVDGVTLR